jgi:hypothetical protein
MSTLTDENKVFGLSDEFRGGMAKVPKSYYINVIFVTVNYHYRLVINLTAQLTP